MHNKLGFSAVEVVIALAVIVILGALGYTAYNNLVVYSNTETATPTASPVVIKSADDLDKVAKELESISLEDTESSEKFEEAASSF